MKSRTGIASARGLLAIAAALAVVAGLSACAPAKVSKTPPHVGPSKVATPSPTPTPLAAPTTRISRTCSQLVSASALATSVGVTVPVVTPPADPDSDIIFAQDGALTCTWSDDYAKDAMQTSNHLVVWVLPDVASANWTTAVKTLVDSGETKTTIIGGNAYGWCNPALPKGTICSIDTLVGTTWLSFEVESLTKTFANSNLGLSHFATLINPVVTAAGAAGFVSEPKWSDPAATATPATCAATLPSSEVETVTGATGIAPIGPDLSDQASLAEYLGAAANLDRVECDLASTDQQTGVFAVVVPGGGWDWSQVQAHDSAQPGYMTVPSLGTNAVEFSDAGSDQEEIEWVRGDNLCSVDVSLTNHAKQASEALALATYVNNEIPG